MDDHMRLPVQPFFSCEEAMFSVMDKAALRQQLLQGSLAPVLSLSVGPRNVFERSPRRVLEHRGAMVAVECDGETTVYLDFDSSIARTRTPEGEFRYMGDLEEGNDGKGFIRVG